MERPRLNLLIVKQPPLQQKQKVPFSMTIHPLGHCLTWFIINNIKFRYCFFFSRNHDTCLSLDMHMHFRLKLTCTASDSSNIQFIFEDKHYADDLLSNHCTMNSLHNMLNHRVDNAGLQSLLYSVHIDF